MRQRIEQDVRGMKEKREKVGGRAKARGEETNRLARFGAVRPSVLDVNGVADE